MEIYKSTDNNELREKVFSGGENYYGIVELAIFEKNKFFDFLPGINPANRMQRTRVLATQYLTEIASEPKFKTHYERCLDALEMKLLNVAKEGKHATPIELEQFGKNLNVVTANYEEKKSLRSMLKDARDKIKHNLFDEVSEPFQGKSLEQIEELLNQNSDEIERYSDEIERLNLNIRLIKEESSYKQFIASENTKLKAEHDALQAFLDNLPNSATSHKGLQAINEPELSDSASLANQALDCDGMAISKRQEETPSVTQEQLLDGIRIDRLENEYDYPIIAINRNKLRAKNVDLQQPPAHVKKDKLTEYLEGHSFEKQDEKKVEKRSAQQTRLDSVKSEKLEKVRREKRRQTFSDDVKDEN